MSVEVDVSVGHGWRDDGRYDPGTIGTDGRYENHEAHEVGVQLAEALGRCGVAYHIENRGTANDKASDPNFTGSIRRINERTKPKVCVELHFDWSKGPLGLVALHSGSSGGTKLATKIRDAAHQFALPLSGDGVSQDTDYGRRVRLAFVRNTNPPACLVELARIADYSPEHNEVQGEAVARGIVETLGKTWIPKSSPKAEFDYKVVVAFDDTNDNAEGRGFDMALAHSLGKRWIFKVLPRTHLDLYNIEWVVGVGNDGADMTRHGADGGVAFTGQTRWETLDRVQAAILGGAPARDHAWG